MAALVAFSAKPSNAIVRIRSQIRQRILKVSKQHPRRSEIRPLLHHRRTEVDCSLFERNPRGRKVGGPREGIGSGASEMEMIIKQALIDMLVEKNLFT
jgi:hypothetical protein